MIDDVEIILIEGKVQRLIFADIKFRPVNQGVAVDVDRAATGNRAIDDTRDSTIHDLAARRHGKDALRERQADSHRQEGLSRFMMESPFHDVHSPLRTASSG